MVFGEDTRCLLPSIRTRKHYYDSGLHLGEASEIDYQIPAPHVDIKHTKWECFYMRFLQYSFDHTLFGLKLVFPSLTHATFGLFSLNLFDVVPLFCDSAPNLSYLSVACLTSNRRKNNLKTYHHYFRDAVIPTPVFANLMFCFVSIQSI